MAIYRTISVHHLIKPIPVSNNLGSCDHAFYYSPGDERFMWLSSNRIGVGNIHSILVRSSGHIGGNPVHTNIHAQRPALQLQEVSYRSGFICILICRGDLYKYVKRCWQK
ncbi:MAG: hypothetical protein HFG16_04010 [Erysipelotrichaceae bacterium]|nr:hypothetical protein [Erysipelotrichaceae bacterium]